MKLTAIILFIVCAQVSAKGYSQGITLSEKNAPLERIFKEIKKQTGYSFLYSSEVLKLSRKVDIEVKHATLEYVLNTCFANQLLTWEIEEKTIIVKPKLEDQNKDLTPPPIDLHGKVVNERGEPVAGASVSVKNSNNGTITDKNGEFRLEVPDGNVTLIISYVGYESQELAVGNNRSFTVSLKLRAQQLGDVVIVTSRTRELWDIQHKA